MCKSANLNGSRGCRLLHDLADLFRCQQHGSAGRLRDRLDTMLGQGVIQRDVWVSRFDASQEANQHLILLVTEDRDGRAVGRQAIEQVRGQCVRPADKLLISESAPFGNMGHTLRRHLDPIGESAGSSPLRIKSPGK